VGGSNLRPERHLSNGASDQWRCVSWAQPPRGTGAPARRTPEWAGRACGAAASVAAAPSVVLAVTFAYFGNRHWTFRHRDRSGLGREYALFFMLNAVGLLIALTCLFFSHYVLGLQGPLADNVSANGVGLALGTTFRFWSYRKWVFPEIADDELAAELDAEVAQGAAQEPSAVPR